MYPNSWEEQNYQRQMNEQATIHSRRLEKMTEEQIKGLSLRNAHKKFMDYLPDEKVF